MKRRATAVILIGLVLPLLAIAQPAAGSLLARSTASTTSTVPVSLVEAIAPTAPRLGHRRHYAPYGKGWGRVSPRIVFNGGAPSGLAKEITWRRWGAERSVGTGKIALYRPDGGYYSRPGRIKVRAQRLDACGRTPAYTRLVFKAAKRPGEPVSGRWQPWAGGGSICR